MIRTALGILLLAVVAVGGYVAHAVIGPRPQDTVRVRSEGPTVEKLRKLSKLVTLEVPISDVQVSELEGITGSITMVIAVKGDVQIAVDFQQAAFEDVDEMAKSALLLLHPPKPQRPRLDHEQTRIVGIQRSGLWKYVPGQAGEKTLTQRAMAEAQHSLQAVAERPEIVAKACAHTEKVIGEFFGAMGWDVRVQWDDR